MPPRVKFTREDVLNAAFDLVSAQGMEALNARAIAARLGSSTQPLFRVFTNMDEIRAEVTRMAADKCYEYMEKQGDPDMPLYKRAGMGYIRFAREKPQLFRLLFMCDRSGSDQGPDDRYADILQISSEATGLDIETTKLFHMHMWVYVHGLATMAATNYLELDDELISTLLTGHFRAMLTSLSNS